MFLSPFYVSHLIIWSIPLLILFLLLSFSFHSSFLSSSIAVNYWKVIKFRGIIQPLLLARTHTHAAVNVPHATPIKLICDSTLRSQTDVYYSLGSVRGFNQSNFLVISVSAGREKECVFGFKSAKELICVGGGEFSRCYLLSRPTSSPLPSHQQSVCVSVNHTHLHSLPLVSKPICHRQLETNQSLALSHFNSSLRLILYISLLSAVLPSSSLPLYRCSRSLSQHWWQVLAFWTVLIQQINSLSLTRTHTKCHFLMLVDSMWSFKSTQESLFIKQRVQIWLSIHTIFHPFQYISSVTPFSIFFSVTWTGITHTLTGPHFTVYYPLSSEQQWGYGSLALLCIFPSPPRSLYCKFK